MSGSKNQTIGNIQRTKGLFSVRVSYLKGYETLGNKLISCLDSCEKTEGILSKAVFTGFFVFCLRPDGPQGICPFQREDVPPSVIVSGLSQAGEVRQPRD